MVKKIISSLIEIYRNSLQTNQEEITLDKKKIFILDVINYINHISCNMDDINEFTITSLALDDVAINTTLSKTLDYNRIYEFCSIYYNELNTIEPFMLMSYPSIKMMETSLDTSKFNRIQLHKSFLAFQFQYIMLLMSIYVNKYILKKDEKNIDILFSSRYINEVILETKVWLNSNYQFDKQKLFIVDEILTYIYLKQLHSSLIGKFFKLEKEEIKRYISDNTNYKVIFESGITDSETNSKCIISTVYLNRLSLENLKLLEKCLYVIKNKYKDYQWIINVSYINKFKIKYIQEYHNQLSLYTSELHNFSDIQNIVNYVMNRYELVKESKINANHSAYFSEYTNVSLFDDLITDFYISLIKTALERLNYLDYAIFNYEFINQVVTTISSYSVKPFPKQTDTFVTYISRVAVYLSNTLRTLSTDQVFISNVRNSVYSNSEVVSHTDLQNILLEFITSCFKENMQYSVLNFTNLYYDTVNYIISTKLNYLQDLTNSISTSYFTSIFTSNMLSTYTYYMTEGKQPDLFSVPSRLRNDYQVFNYNCYKIICGIIASTPYLLRCQNLFWKIYTKINTDYLITDFYIIPDNKCLTLESSTLVTPDLKNYYYIEGVNTQYIPIDSFFIYLRSMLVKMSQKCIMPMLKTGFYIDISNDVFARYINTNNNKLRNYLDLINLLSIKYNYRLKFTRLSSILLFSSYISTLEYLMSLIFLNQYSNQKNKYTYIQVNYQLINKLITSSSFFELINTFSNLATTIQPLQISKDYEVVDINVNEYFQHIDIEILTDLSYSISESYHLDELIFSLQEEKYLLQNNLSNPIENLISNETNIPYMLTLALVDQNLEYHQDEEGNIVINEDSSLITKLHEYGLISDELVVNIINQFLNGANFNVENIGECIEQLANFMNDVNNDPLTKEQIIQNSIVKSNITSILIDDLQVNYSNGILSDENIKDIYQVFLPPVQVTDGNELIERLRDELNNVSDSLQQISLTEIISDTTTKAVKNNIDETSQISFIHNVENLYLSSLSSENKSFSNDINLLIESTNLSQEDKERLKTTIISLIPENELTSTKETSVQNEILQNDFTKINKPSISQETDSKDTDGASVQQSLASVIAKKNGLTSPAQTQSKKSSSVFEKGLFASTANKISKPTGLEKSLNKLNDKVGGKINSLYNFSIKSASNITSILFKNPTTRSVKSVANLLSTLQSGVSKFMKLPSVIKGMAKSKSKDFTSSIGDTISFANKLGSLFKMFSGSDKKENPSTKIARYDIEFDTPEMKVVEPSIEDNCIFGFIEPPLVLFDGMQNIQNDINAIVYTNEVFLTLKPGTIKKVDNAPFFVFQLTKFEETTKLVKQIMKRLGFEIDSKQCSSIDSEGFVFMLSNYTIQHSHSNDASVSFINRFATLLTDVNRQWSVLFNKTKTFYDFTNAAINKTEQGAESLASSKLGQTIGNIADFITPDKLENMMKNVGSELWSQFRSVMPGMVAGGTFDSPKIVTGSSSNISIECDILLTSDLPIPSMIKERIIKPYMLLHVLSTPLTMYDYLVLNGVVHEGSNDECYQSLKYLYMMPVYLKATLQYGYKGLSKPSKSMYGLSPRKFYTVDCIITSVNARDFVFRDGYIVSAKVSFTLTPVYNVLYGSTSKNEESSMLTLGWLAKNFEDSMKNDIYDSIDTSHFTTIKKEETQAQNNYQADEFSGVKIQEPTGYENEFEGVNANGGTNADLNNSSNTDFSSTGTGTGTVTTTDTNTSVTPQGNNNQTSLIDQNNKPVSDAKPTIGDGKINVNIDGNKVSQSQCIGNCDELNQDAEEMSKFLVKE